MIVHIEGETPRDALQKQEVDGIAFDRKVYASMFTLLQAALGALRRNDTGAFSVIFATAEGFDMQALFAQEKRYSDILVKIDEVEDTYALVCLETPVEGGFQFAQRLLRHMKTGFAERVYMAVVDVRSATYSAEEVISKMLEIYYDAKAKRREGEAVLFSMM